MKVLIISPCGLPIPAVKGGAVLTLLESIILQNEIYNKMQLTVVGIYDEEAVTKAKQYTNTSFSFVKIPSPIKVADNLLGKVLAGICKKSGMEFKKYIQKVYVLFALRKQLKNNDYDRIVFQNAAYLLLLLKDKKLCEKYREKLYYHIHNGVPDNIYKEGLKQCKLLLISNYLKKKIIRICGSGIEERICLVRNGFDCANFVQEVAENEMRALKAQHGIDESKKVVMYVGRITPTKGIDKLLEAFLNLSRDDIVLVVIGSCSFGEGRTSPFEENMKRFIAGLSGKIVFTGYVPYKDIWKYYKMADVAVLPSMWEEPAGLTMLEAIVSGIPVITTYSGGIQEYLPQDFAVLLHRDEHIVQSIADAINYVLEHEDEWEGRKEKAIVYIKEQFSEERFFFDFLKGIEL